MVTWRFVYVVACVAHLVAQMQFLGLSKSSDQHTLAALLLAPINFLFGSAPFEYAWVLVIVALNTFIVMSLVATMRKYFLQARRRWRERTSPRSRMR